METINIILFVLIVGLIAFLIWEIRSYNNYVKSANQLALVGAAMQALFEGVAKDIEGVNTELTAINLRADRLDDSTEILNSNDAIIEVYLNLFRDALGLEADKLSRIGTIKYPESDNSKNLG